MPPHPSHIELTPAVRATLASLRRRIRAYVWLEGLAVAVAWLGLAFWMSWAFDRIFEPPRPVRVVILVLVAIGLAWVLFRWIIRRAAVRLSDRRMAVILERYFPQFNESLLTVLDLSARPLPPEQCHPSMLGHTARMAQETMPAVRLGRVFSAWPLASSAAGALVLGASVAVFALVWPATFGIWARRTLAMSNELWPRKTRLIVDGFPNGATKVARGDDLDVIARADLRMPLVPRSVYVRYRTEGGARLEGTMNRDGNADPAKHRYQQYSYGFRGVLTPITFDVVGGDAAVRDLKIQVVDSPAIVEMWLDCRYPRYTGLGPRTLPVSGVMQVPQGTALVVRARTNKGLIRAEVERALAEPPEPPRVVPAAADRRGFQYALPRFGRDETLLFTLLDEDRIRSREPVRLVLAAVEDQKPQLTVRLRAIGTAVTPQADVPAVGTASDDYGLARVWFEYAVDQGKPAAETIASPPGNATEVPLDHALAVGKLGVKPGQKIGLCVKAVDRYDLGKQPNVGASERWLLDVVTPEHLRAMLEARELVLRQRFEHVIEEVLETRETLARMEFSTEPKKPAGAAAGAEPGDEEGQPRDRSPQRLLALRTLRVERAMQNSEKDAQEILGVAEAFDDIRQELVNNHIDTEELQMRLRDRIAQPLRQIAEKRFPDLDRRLDRLQAVLADEKLAPKELAQTTAELDSILAAMRQVLDQMLELEDYNEVVELLRTIIRAQEKIEADTKKLHEEGLRDLKE